MNASEAWLDNAVLVYGPRKAGTTLFQNLLDGTGELAVYPAELKLKYFVKRQPQPRLIDAYRARTRVLEVDSPNLSREKYEALWRDECANDLGDLVRRDMVHVMAACNGAPSSPRLWAAKEVGGDTKGILRLWWELFPQGRVLFILRDPLMVTRAVLNDRRRKERRLSAWQIARETLDPLKVVAAAARLLDESAAFAITYEDLVADTPATMRRVAEFLDIQFDEMLTKPTLFGEPIVVRTASRPEKQVFRSESEWHEGLTVRERRIVAATARLARLAGLRVDYPALRRKINP